MTADGVRLTFAPGLLAIDTNSKDMRGFLFGQPPVWRDDQRGTDPLVTLEYNILRGNDERLLANGAAVLTRSRKLAGGLRATRLIDASEPGRIRLLVSRGYLHWSSLRFTASHPRPEHMLSNLAVVGLLSRGAVPLHGGAVAAGDAGTLIFAPSNTGKTYSTWLLVTRYGYDFLGDDMLATDGTTVHGFPFTATGVPPGVETGPLRRLDSLRRLVMIYPNKLRLIDSLPPGRVRAEAKVRRIVFLRRGTPGLVAVGREEAADQILRLNRMEFKHLGAKYLSQLWWACGFPDLQQLALREAEIISRTVRSAEEIIEIRSDDPATFAPRIAEILG